MFDFWTGAEGLPMWGFVVRSSITYAYIFLIMKVLGQRSIGTLNPLDFLFGVLIGDVLGEPLSDGATELSGPFMSAATISGLHLTFAFISLKLPRFRRVVEDEPIILIAEGRILRKQLTKTKITLESLLMDLRLQGAADPSVVDYAVLESNGQISVIKKSEADNVTLQDMQISPPPKGYPTVLIEDGRVVDRNLSKVGTKEWLREEIRKYGYETPADIFLMTMNKGGQVYISPK